MRCTHSQSLIKAVVNQSNDTSSFKALRILDTHMQLGVTAFCFNAHEDARTGVSLLVAHLPFKDHSYHFPDSITHGLQARDQQVRTYSTSAYVITALLGLYVLYSRLSKLTK